MRKVVWTMAAFVFGFGAASCGGGSQAPAPSAGAAQNPVSDAVRNNWNSVKRDIKESAEQMPEENFAFKPTPDVRSFGDILTHVAGASYEFCASAKNEDAPFQEKSFEGKMTTKADIVKVTNDAIAYCDGAFAQLTDANLSETVHAAFGGKNQVTRAGSLIGQIGHDNEHYGNLVTYFRLKNTVPPSSKRSGG
jgi:uncharacterized damage-inducible protein DinB